MSIKNVVNALAKFQKDLRPITKESTGSTGRGNYKYASLPHIWSKVEPLLEKNGLLCLTIPFVEDGRNGINVNLIHVESCERMDLGRFIEPSGIGNIKNPIQAMGANMTYLRRYVVVTALGIIVDEDTDGKSSFNGMILTDKDTKKSIQECDSVDELKEIKEFILKSKKLIMFKADLQKRFNELSFDFSSESGDNDVNQKLAEIAGKNNGKRNPY